MSLIIKTRICGSRRALLTRFKSILHDKQLYKRLVDCKAADAQKLLNTLQQLLDVADLDNHLRKDLIVALQRISTRSGLYPACYELDGIQQIGQYPVTAGGFADIYKGKLRAQVVCLKTIRLYEKSQIDHVLKKMSKEAVLWSQLSHPNVLAIYGLFLFQGRIAIVSTWMENGDINNYLRRNPTAIRRMLALDVGNGLAYLHDLSIIHGDLKGPNILVDDGGRALLADFGISSVSSSEIVEWTSQTTDNSSGGTVRWQAPELISVEDNKEEGRTKHTKASDIYAWGCVCLEIFTGKIPFANLPNDYNVIHHVQSGGRPQRPLASSPSWTVWGLTEEIWSCMDSCWSRDPSQRPIASSLVGLLSTGVLEDIRRSFTSLSLSPADFRRQMSKSIDLVTLNALDSIVQSTGSSIALADEINVPMEGRKPYVIVGYIGKGSLSTVHKGYYEGTHQQVAIKTIKHDSLTAELSNSLQREIQILKLLSHTHIVQLIDIIDTEQDISLIMEYCGGGNLTNYIANRGRVKGLEYVPSPSSAPIYYAHPHTGGLDEIVVRSFLRQLGVPILKISDFGFARTLPDGMMTDTLGGASLYTAPEILRYEKYTAKVDLWSVGAVLFEMCVGKPPFHAQNYIELLRRIEKSNGLKFPDESPDPENIGGGSKDSPVPRDVKELIRVLLKRNPLERAGFEEFFNSEAVKNSKFPKPQKETSRAPSEKLPQTNQRSVHNGAPPAGNEILGSDWSSRAMENLDHGADMASRAPSTAKSLSEAEESLLNRDYVLIDL
ncbi:hypothetical protein DXG01_014330 [Tephrocybe rancida]|nr:hypothetical protein DXG01_014330 [Tephrocybe rancida]